jgi:hypothetical protein
VASLGPWWVWVFQNTKPSDMRAGLRMVGFSFRSIPTVPNGRSGRSRSSMQPVLKTFPRPAKPAQTRKRTIAIFPERSKSTNYRLRNTGSENAAGIFAWKKVLPVLAALGGPRRKALLCQLRRRGAGVDATGVYKIMQGSRFLRAIAHRLHRLRSRYPSWRMFHGCQLSGLHRKVAWRDRV